MKKKKIKILLLLIAILVVLQISSGIYSNRSRQVYDAATGNAVYVDIDMEVAEQDPAAILEITADKESYSVGDTATVTIKTGSDITSVDLRTKLGEFAAWANENDAVVQSDGTKIFTMSFKIERSTFFYVEAFATTQNGTYVRSNFELKANSPKCVLRGIMETDSGYRVEIGVDHVVRSVTFYDMDDNEIGKTNNFRATFIYMFDFPKSEQTKNYKAVIDSMAFAEAEILYFSIEGSTGLEVVEQDPAAILEITTDKESYSVGDTATVTIKTGSDITSVDLWTKLGEFAAWVNENNAVTQNDGTKIFTMSFKIERSTYFYIEVSGTSRNGEYIRSNFELKANSPKGRVSVKKAGSGYSDTHDIVEVWVDHVVRSVTIYDMDDNEIAKTSNFRSMFIYTFEFPKSAQAKDYKVVIESMAFAEAETLYFSIEASDDMEVVEQEVPDPCKAPSIRDTRRKNKSHHRR